MMDAKLTQWINSAAGHLQLLDSLAAAASQFGVPFMVLMTALQWWSAGERDRVRHGVVAAGLSFILCLAINQIVLLFIHRPRPYEAGVTHLIVPSSPDWSFPSDHATASMAIVAAFAILGLNVRAILFGILAVLICWSRIYVGTHYVSDILGGAVTAIAAACVVKLCYRRNAWLDRKLTSIL